jgi:hypothetical protein
VPFALTSVSLIQDYLRKLSVGKCSEIATYESLGELSLEREPLVIVDYSDEDN